jgi:hypothetical protein
VLAGVHPSSGQIVAPGSGPTPLTRNGAPPLPFLEPGVTSEPLERVSRLTG